jgi:hypothetical protein
MQHSTNKTTSKTNKSSTSKTKPRSKKRYTAAQIEGFKLIRRYESELRAEAQARADQREWEAFLAWQARNNSAIVQAPAVPARALQAPALPVPSVLNFTPEDIATILEFAEQYREQHRTGAA